MSSIVDKINEVETERADRNHTMQIAMDEYESSQERKGDSILMKWLRSQKRARLREIDTTNDLFNEHSIIGFENRNVND